MPTILSLPRELRDQIYQHCLEDNLPTYPLSVLQCSRKIVHYDPISTNTSYCKDQVRYPETTSLPPAYSLLGTCRQMHVEVLDYMKRMGPLRYKIDLLWLINTRILYPTWISVPAFSKHIDILDVELRVRKETTPLISYEAEVYWTANEPWFTLLKCFLERGIYFLSKQKKQKISIGVLALNINVPLEDEMRLQGEVSQCFKHFNASLDESILLENVEDAKKDCCQDEFYGESVGKCRVSFMGKVKSQWVSAETKKFGSKTALYILMNSLKHELHEGVSGNGV